MIGRALGASSTTMSCASRRSASVCSTNAADMRSPAAGGATRSRGARAAGIGRSAGAGRASRSRAASFRLPTTASPCGVHAAVPGSSTSCTSVAPGGTCGPKPSMWYVNAGAPNANTRSCPSSRATIFSRIAGRKPANSGWSSGKLQRPDIGATYTRARCRSASRTVSSHAPARSSAAPTTNAGRCAASSASPSRASASGSGRTTWLTSRAGSSSAG
ncbi:hypothetical protein FEP10_05299 [Burkholderia multivorans]|nr:hypothetical protein [Burkholderia multivorans]